MTLSNRYHEWYIMRKRVVLCIVLGGLLVAAETAWGGVTLTIVDTDGDPHRTKVQAGSPFEVILQVDTTISILGLQVRVQETTESPSGLFQLNSVSFQSPPWSGQANDQVVPSLPDPMNGPSYKSGYIADTAADLQEGTGIGIFSFVTLSLTFVGPTAFLNAILNLCDILYGDLNYDEYAGTAGTDYEVTVIFPPDLDDDGDVDMDDFAIFERCRTAPGIGPAGKYCDPQVEDCTPCQRADLDEDEDVDQDDFAVFQRCFSGSDQSANPDCLP